jgi:hypothetical protein
MSQIPTNHGKYAKYVLIVEQQLFFSIDKNFLVAEQ